MTYIVWQLMVTDQISNFSSSHSNDLNALATDIKNHTFGRKLKDTDAVRTVAWFPRPPDLRVVDVRNLMNYSEK